MSPIGKIVRIAKKNGVLGFWEDSDEKYDVHMPSGSEKPNTYIVRDTQLRTMGVPEAKMDRKYLYNHTKPSILGKLHQRNLVILYGDQGDAFLIKRVKNVNIGFYVNRKIKKSIVSKNPSLKLLSDDLSAAGIKGGSSTPVINATTAKRAIVQPPEMPRETLLTAGNIEGKTADDPTEMVKSNRGPVSKNKRQKTIYAIFAVIVAALVIIFLIHSLLPVTKSSASAPIITTGSVAYVTNTTLSGNVFAGNVTIDPGVFVMTDGYNFFVSGTFNNLGTIITGHYQHFTNISGSYGGSGGGGGFTYATGASGQDGFNTIAAGGSGGGIGGDGSTPTQPSMDARILDMWNSSPVINGFLDGISEYLTGASGGYSGNGQSGSVPGYGGFGILIEADTVYAGTIYSNGTNCTGGGAGSGGGGGGSIVLAYGSGGLHAGVYHTAGGFGESVGTSYADNYGGQGGSGSILGFHFIGSEPLPAVHSQNYLLLEFPVTDSRILG